MSTATPHTGGPTGRSRSIGKILLLVIGSVLALIGLALLAAGGFVLWANATQRDDDGYFTTPTEHISPSSYALTHEGIEIFDEAKTGGVGFDPGELATVRVRAEGVPGQPIFVGIGPAGGVTGYLRDVEHDEIEDLHYDPFTVEYAHREGGERARPPREEDFWVASASGSGEQTITWPLEEGTWSFVVMNEDASRDVSVDLELGAKINFLVWIALGLLVGGGALLLGGGAMIYFGARTAPEGAGPAPAAFPASGSHAGARAESEQTHPVAVEGELDPPSG